MVIAFIAFVISRRIDQMELENERHEWENRQTHLQLEQSLQLIAGLQAQRHDYRNQLQVLQTLLALGKHEEVARRIDEYRLALDELASLNKVENTILQALLLAMWTRAKEFDTDFRVECKADLKSFNQPPVKISRIFTSLLRNAVEAAALRRGGSAVSVAIWQEGGDFRFSIRHNGPTLPPRDRGWIFPPGGSGAPDDGGGYGLCVAKELIEELGGRFAVRSDEGEGMEFLVILPAEPIG
ncbi:MAG: Spo0B domain-containing protein [Firmicutes bacterium]|nr:Spo0B domain-containing protein [Bacillota bacterium]